MSITADQITGFTASIRGRASHTDRNLGLSFRTDSHTTWEVATFAFNLPSSYGEVTAGHRSDFGSSYTEMLFEMLVDPTVEIGLHLFQGDDWNADIAELSLTITGSFSGSAAATPGAVSIEDYSVGLGYTSHPDDAVVGSGNVWADANDATGVHLRTETDFETYVLAGRATAPLTITQVAGGGAQGWTVGSTSVLRPIRRRLRP